MLVPSHPMSGLCGFYHLSSRFSLLLPPLSRSHDSYFSLPGVWSVVPDLTPYICQILNHDSIRHGLVMSDASWTKSNAILVLHLEPFPNAVTMSFTVSWSSCFTNSTLNSLNWLDILISEFILSSARYRSNMWERQPDPNIYYSYATISQFPNCTHHYIHLIPAPYPIAPSRYA